MFLYRKTTYSLRQLAIIYVDSIYCVHVSDAVRRKCVQICTHNVSKDTVWSKMAPGKLLMLFSSRLLTPPEGNTNIDR